jgi:hypothetical protein
MLTQTKGDTYDAGEGGGMNCCQSPLQAKLKASTEATDTWTTDRRTVLKGLAGLALGLGLGLGRPGSAQGAKKIRLAFCSQLLCVVPYEATRAGAPPRGSMLN